jgi:DNA-binding NarL/FixJ family response regulator
MPLSCLRCREQVYVVAALPAADPLIDCLVSADTVTIHDERCVLCVLHITDRKRSQDELVAAIEAVMADTSWFSRSVAEKLTALRQTSPSCTAR